MSEFAWASLAGWLAVIIAARLIRGSFYAIFGGVILGIMGLVNCALHNYLTAELRGAMYYLTFATHLHLLSLLRPNMRPVAFRILVTWPAMIFIGATLLAVPWAVATSLGYFHFSLVVPYALATIGFFEGFWQPDTIQTIELDGEDAGPLSRHPKGAQKSERPLRLVQITDPHLGPFMSENRLQKLLQAAVDKSPDLILLTGDFMTMESQTDPQVLERAFSPLGNYRGKVFACMGNHDHEAPEIVFNACEKAGIRMLIDEAELVQTEAGPVQVLGYDFTYRDRADRMQKVSSNYPRVSGTMRLVLLHDPGAFVHLPPGSADLVLSGHTHGGQLGLLRLGLPHTVLSILSSMPDHGFWSRGTDRLYVHRGTGHYGFPLRIGVPAEHSLLEVHRT